jgi:hypothetical protein
MARKRDRILMAPRGRRSTSGSETVGCALRFVEFIGGEEIRARHGRNDQLRDAVAAAYGERLAA